MESSQHQVVNNRHRSLRALAAVLVLTGLCWLGIVLASHFFPHSKPSALLEIQSANFSMAARIDWLAVLLSVWTGALLFVTIRCVYYGKDESIQTEPALPKSDY